MAAPFPGAAIPGINLPLNGPKLVSHASFPFLPSTGMDAQVNENTEIIQGLYAAFATGDIPAVLGLLADNISWTEAEGFPYAGTFVGPNAVLENVFMKLGSEWDGFASVPEELITEGDTVVALGQYSGTCKATGKAFASPFAHIWKMRDGKVHTFRQITDTVLVQAAMR